MNSGAFVPTTHCAVNSGSGAVAGATEMCVIAANTLVVGSYYNFELRITDSATVAETKTSTTTLQTVTVSSTLTAPAKPSVSATHLDVDQTLMVTGTIPTTGTGPSLWTWQISVNGGSYLAATQCAMNGGVGASMGATETCTIAPNTLTVGDHYNFKLQVKDSATVVEKLTSSASSTVHISSALTAPGTPRVSLTRIAVSQALTVTGKIPTRDRTVHVDLDGVGERRARTAPPRSARPTAAPARRRDGHLHDHGGNTDLGRHLQLRAAVTDSASAPEVQTSAPSPTVTVA